MCGICLLSLQLVLPAVWCHQCSPFPEPSSVPLAQCHPHAVTILWHVCPWVQQGPGFTHRDWWYEEIEANEHLYLTRSSHISSQIVSYSFYSFSAILALSSSHTAGLVHSGREEYKLAEFQHNGIFQSGAWNILKLEFLHRRIQEGEWVPLVRHSCEQERRVKSWAELGWEIMSLGKCWGIWCSCHCHATWGTSKHSFWLTLLSSSLPNREEILCISDIKYGPLLLCCDARQLMECQAALCSLQTTQTHPHWAEFMGRLRGLLLLPSPHSQIPPGAPSTLFSTDGAQSGCSGRGLGAGLGNNRMF